MLTVFAVRTGQVYGADYVLKLKAMVGRHLDAPHRFVCLTDRPRDLKGVETRDISGHGLRGWWGKMALFDPALRGPGRGLYLDLDTVVCGDLGPLADFDGDFGICANFARAHGALNWPCRYGSCVMAFGDGWGAELWRAFGADRARIIAAAGRYGDQKAIEMLMPDADLLQDFLPEGFMLSKWDLPEAKPRAAAIVVFGGRQKPHNCTLAWVREHWR